jgi:hypothetical protein
MSSLILAFLLLSGFFRMWFQDFKKQLIRVWAGFLSISEISSSARLAWDFTAQPKELRFITWIIANRQKQITSPMFALGSSEMIESEQDFLKPFTYASYALNQMSGKIRNCNNKDKHFIKYTIDFSFLHPFFDCIFEFFSVCLATMPREEEIVDFIEIPKLWGQDDVSTGECART